MEAHRAIEVAHAAGVKAGTARTIAQGFCFLAGVTLIAAGVLGFIFGGSGFGTGDHVQGKDFIVFEVNGWHNVLHIASGAVLLLLSLRAAAAATGALVFGLVYAGIAVWGLADGNDVANLVAVDRAGNWLHVGIAAMAIAVGLLSGGLALSARRTRRAAEAAVAEPTEPATASEPTSTEREEEEAQPPA